MAHILTSDVAYFCGRVQECAWSYFTGHVEDEDWSAFLGDSKRVYTTAPPGTLLLTAPYAYGTPSAAQRRALGDLIRDTPGTKNISHHAFVTDSSLLMAINSAITWLGNKPWIEKTFTEPKRGLIWLTRAAQSLDPAAIADDMERVIPPRLLWSKLKRAQLQASP